MGAEYKSKCKISCKTGKLWFIASCITQVRSCPGANRLPKVTTDFSFFRSVKASPAYHWCIDQCVKGDLQGQCPTQEYLSPPFAVLDALAQWYMELSCQQRGGSSRKCRKWSKCNGCVSFGSQWMLRGRQESPDGEGAESKGANGL